MKRYYYLMVADIWRNPFLQIRVYVTKPFTVKRTFGVVHSLAKARPTCAPVQLDSIEIPALDWDCLGLFYTKLQWSSEQKLSSQRKAPLKKLFRVGYFPAKHFQNRKISKWNKILLKLVYYYKTWKVYINIQSKKDSVGSFVRFIEMFICPPLGQRTQRAPKA